VTQLGENVRVLREHVYRKGGKTGDGVATRDRDIEQLVAQRFDVWKRTKTSIQLNTDE
jgi:hypothetical protein